eukprot:290772-Hanusia_phi.AAC.1
MTDSFPGATCQRLVTRDLLCLSSCRRPCFLNPPPSPHSEVSQTRPKEYHMLAIEDYWID